MPKCLYFKKPYSKLRLDDLDTIFLSKTSYNPLKNIPFCHTNVTFVSNDQPYFLHDIIYNTLTRIQLKASTYIKFVSQ